MCIRDRKFSGVTILQGVEFPVFLLILSWALQQCSATALPVIQLPHQCYRLSKISCLCLFDLSAEFDTIDHNILLSRLSSWFGITGTVLDCFKSHLSSRPFRVKCESSFSSLYIYFVASRKYLFSAPGFYHVHHPSQFINLISSQNHHSVCRWYATFLFLSSFRCTCTFEHNISMTLCSNYGWLLIC